MVKKYGLLVFLLGLNLLMPPFLWAQENQNKQNDVINKNFSGWSIVTQKMLAGPVFKDYPGACGELTIGDGSKIVLLRKTGGERIKYSVVKIAKSGGTKILLQDSWPEGNPSPFLSPNKDSEPKDIKTNKKWHIDPQFSFVFDEWAYRWVIAKVNGRWEKILVQSEE